MHWVYLFVAIIAEVFATSALKMSAEFTKLLPSIVVVVGYLVAFYFLSLTLRTMPVAIVYALWSGIGIVLISLVGWIFLKQNLDTAALFGIGLITSGVLVLNIFSNSVAH
jgi:small multidrug resistance pump